jgi:DNA polymerase-3 subunit epsilon
MTQLRNGGILPPLLRSPDMRVKDATFTAIDFESAGARPGGTDVPVQIGFATMTGTEIDEGSLFTSYLRSDQPITWGARKVHGIRDEDIVDAPAFNDLWPRVRDALGSRVVVAHGSGTEKRFLRAFPFHGFDPWVDTLKVAHAAFPDAESHSLESLIDMLGLNAAVDAHCPDAQWHDALYDSVASLVLLRETVRLCELEERDVEELVDPNRVAYFRRRAASKQQVE